MARVKELREILDLSQEKFAERAGLKYKHYQSVEAGRKNNITFYTVLKMAEACGVEPWELLQFDVEPSALAENSASYVAKAKPPKKKAKLAKRKPSA